MASQPTQPGNQPQPAQKTSAQLPKTVRVPRLHGGEPVVEQEKSPIAEDFSKPLKRVGFVVGSLFIIVLLASFIFNAIAGMFGNSAPKTPAVTASSPSSATSQKTAADPDRNACSGIPAKMKAAQISGKQVDKAFIQKHPDRANKPLDLSAPGDRPLRQEWCQIAGELADQKR